MSDLVVIVRERRPDGEEPVPVFASDDPVIVAAVGRAIADRLAGAPVAVPAKPHKRAA